MFVEEILAAFFMQVKSSLKKYTESNFGGKAEMLLGMWFIFERHMKVLKFSALFPDKMTKNVTCSTDEDEEG